MMVLGPQAGYRLAQDHGIAAHFLVRGHDGFVERHTDAMEPYVS